MGKDQQPGGSHPPPLVRIEGPAERLPQWKSKVDLKQFQIKSLSNKLNKGEPQKLAPDLQLSEQKENR